MRWSPSPWFWFGVAHVHSPQYLPSSSLALSKCSGFTSQPPERSNSTFCFNNKKTTCGKFGSSPAVLKGEEKGVLLALHMSGPLQPPGPISSHTSGCSCSSLGQPSHLPCRDTVFNLYWWGKTAALILSHGRCSNRAEVIIYFFYFECKLWKHSWV